MSRPHLDALLGDCRALLQTKAHDYARPGQTHSNFLYSAALAQPFPDAYKPYAVLIGVKLARLAELLQPGKTPHHESIRDSLLDLVNYCALMAGGLDDLKPGDFA